MFFLIQSSIERIREKKEMIEILAKFLAFFPVVYCYFCSSEFPFSLRKKCREKEKEVKRLKILKTNHLVYARTKLYVFCGPSSRGTSGVKERKFLWHGRR